MLRLISLLLFFAYVQALDWTATPFNPPSVPLAVRTPYLSAWLPQGSGAALNDVWPTFWTGSILGWAGFVKVDGIAYSFLGSANVPGASFQKATQTGFSFTSTQSTFVLSAGSVELTVSFLSPVDATDLVKQSIPFAYMTVSAASTDGNEHSVQVYTDISAEWVSGDTSLTANWTTSTGSILTHQVQLTDPLVFSEVSDHTQYGSAFYSTISTDRTTYQTGADVTVRAHFISNGVLPNTQDTNFRAVSDNWPVFALASDLGSISSPTEPLVFAIGHIRDPAISYIVANNVHQDRSLYFWSQYSDAASLIKAFLQGYQDALSQAIGFDSQVENDASAISEDYAGIVALSIRQAMGSMEVTISRTNDGSWNTDDVLVFMKEISSDGNINTVDVIFPAWPVLLYTNPILGKHLLEVLFRYQATGQYPNAWSVHDIGSSYPKAFGHNDGRDEPMPVEVESGNMLIMSLSYAQRTGDNSHLSTYFGLLDQWTQFLITDALIPANQISTDDFAGSLANQTNLAIKGIVGIRAMAEIASLLGDTDKSDNYTSIAESYVTQWQTLAASDSGEHLTLSYGNSSSWGLSYNLYADKLLRLNLFPTSVYETQTAWYKTVTEPFGVPLDTRHTYTKSDWEIWTSAFMTDNETRNIFISAVKSWASDGRSSQPLGDWYETVNGNPEGFRARPVVGGHRKYQ
ncbi:hypothetical protein EV421DRAFT_1700907 [Armillaria borealis]|uniref:DUF1793-domain-containing protein n=1 Tax=Armillaria borealis TaxID=47425 RepID=A0AA39K2N5_9AGAR|nr:hypothetical protein EV421DRAFT_1700907 [Armillaria borealis]